MQALVNIPALSERTLRRDVASSGISMDAKIQVRIKSGFILNIITIIHQNRPLYWMKLLVFTLTPGGGLRRMGVI